jgi:hypothetical protein
MYLLNFELVNNHKYSLTELESMMPWEREVYASLLIAQIKAENEKKRLLQQQKRGMA